MFLIKKKRHYILIIFLILIIKQTQAQLIYQPYFYQFYQKLNTVEYSPSTNLHTSVKPLLIADSGILRNVYDSLMMSHVDNTHKSWLHQIFFSGHLMDVKDEKYTFNLDYLPDVDIGKELTQKQNTWLNTRGIQLYGTVGPHFFYYSSVYENQGAFPNYETSYINKTLSIPSEIPINVRPFDNGSIDWTYVTSLIGYNINKNVSIVMGQDKTFIGDGYRSLLLSDNAPVSPLLRLSVNLTKNLQYMAMMTYMEDQNAVQFNSFGNNRRKWGAFHYLDWNINNRISIGFFNALIAEEANDQNKMHGFDINYLNPVFFSSALGPSGTAPDHTLFGFNGKYKILNKTTLYGQLLFDQAASPASPGSVSAWQFGFKGSDLFSVDKLNYLVEFNTAAPYTYSDNTPIVNYAQLSQPLGDPLGANFKENIAILNYSVGKFDFQLETQYAKIGQNIGTLNYGDDITLANNVNIPAGNINTGQGMATSLRFAEGTVAYVLNPKYNFRIEAGWLVRDEKNSISDTKTALLTIGLRSSFRDLYHDF
jgi:hypothetical protein